MTELRPEDYITEEQAKQALKSVMDRFAGYIDLDYPDYMPRLEKDYEGDYSTAPWAIVWYEGAPYEWAVKDPAGDVDEEGSSLLGKKVEFPPVKDWPEGVHAEAMNYYVLSLWPADTFVTCR